MLLKTRKKAHVCNTIPVELFDHTRQRERKKKLIEKHGFQKKKEARG